MSLLPKPCTLFRPVAVAALSWAVVTGLVVAYIQRTEPSLLYGVNQEGTA